MDVERFERVAARFERMSRASPAAYRAVVAALGALGYAVVGLVLLVMVALLGLVVLALFFSKNVVVALKIGIPVGITVWALFKAIAVRFERPEGLPLRPADAPALFAELERIRELGRVPRIHRVVVTPELNAAVAQTPRLGILGWPHNDLVVGLPMLLSLSPEAFRAVLAHELGHLSGRHGRTGARIYRVRVTWMQVLAALEARKSWLGAVLARFFRWYGPFFGAATLALAREQEREADRFSAQVTGARAAADALAATNVAAWAIDERFWPALNRATATSPAPPDGYLAALEAEVRAAMQGPGAERALADALRRRSRGVDTHPAPAERIAALGETPRLPPPAPETAAARLLGAKTLDALRAALDERWREDVRERWHAAHEARSAQLARLGELDLAAAAAPLGPDEAWERASLTEDLRGAEAALPLAREAASRHPDHAPARYGLGRMLLAGGDAAGVEHVRRAVALDRDAELPAAQLLAGFHLSRGENELATPWIARADALGAEREEALAERSEVSATDAVEPHRLDAEQVEAIAAALRGDPRVGRAWLVGKRLRHLPGRDPVHVVAVVRRSTWWKLELSRKDDGLAQAVADALPAVGRLFVFVKTDGTAALFRRVKKVPGARVV